MQIIHVVLFTSFSGRPNVQRLACLFTTQDVQNWNQTLKLGQKAKDMGIVLFVMGRSGDSEDEARFRKLASSPKMALLAENESDHMRFMHNLLDDKKDCELFFGNTGYVQGRVFETANLCMNYANVGV